MNQKWTRVAHISDIHIRTIARQHEYRSVFDKLFVSLREQNVDAIIITGDTVHGKTQMSPELINTVHYLFSNLDKLGINIIIIPGNHDAALSNLSRTDALSPILDISGFKNIDYLKHTGIYTYGDVDLYHYSVFEDENDYNNEVKDSDNIKIALYHGMVAGSTNEFDFKYDSTMTADFFKHFDYVMLGDIHKRQELSTHPPMWYCGSLIQQNYGEEVNKGYVIWDIREGNTEFIKIDNDNAFYTILAQNGLLVDQEIKAKKPRIRLYYDSLSIPRLDELKSEITSKYNAIEIIPQEVDQTLDSDIKDEYEDSDFYDIGLQNKLIREYLHSKYPSLKDKQIDDVIVINKDIEHIVQEDSTYSDRKSMSKWSIEKLKFDNFFTFGKKNFIDIGNLSGITGILGANAQGKSSILETITFSIFGTTSKNLNLSQIVNNKKMKGMSHIVIQSDNRLYEIQREITVTERAGKRMASQVLTFNKIDSEGEVIEELNGDDKNQTEKKIREMVGSPEDFLNTSMIAQNNWASFIKSKDTARKNILMSFLDLTAFDKKYKVANKINNDNITVLKELTKEDLSSMLAQVNRDIVKTSELESRHKGDAAAFKLIADELVNEKEILSSQISKVEIEELDVEAEEKLIEDHKTTIKNLGDEAQEIDKKRRTKRRESLDMTDIVLELEIKASDAAKEYEQTIKTEEINRTNIELSWGTHDFDLQMQLDALNKNIKEQMKIVTNTKSDVLLKEQEVKTNTNNQELIKGDFIEHDICSDCVLVKFAFEARDKSEILERELNQLNATSVDEQHILTKLSEKCDKTLLERAQLKADFDKEIAEIEDKIKNSEDMLNASKRLYEEAKTKQDKLKSESELFESQIETKIVTAKSTSQEIKAIQAKIELYKSNLETIEKNASIKQLLKLKTIKLEDANKSYQEKHNLEIRASTELAALYERRANITIKIDTVREKRRITDLYSYYLASIHRNGIPSDVINNTLHKINFEMARLLDSVVDFSLKIVDQEDKIGVFLNYPGGWPLAVEAASGMESIMSEIAIRKALLKISMKPKPTFIAIDEGFSALDSETQASLHLMFNVLRSSFKNTFIISHIEQLKDYMDNNIDLRKENNETHIGAINSL